MKGRPPNNIPATAYDYRRYIALVQAIATGKWTVLKALCEAWQVDIPRGRCDFDGKPTFSGMALTLAEFVTTCEDTP